MSEVSGQMSARAMLYPPPPWTNSIVRLYHGTTFDDARVIAEQGAAVARGSGGRDFGRAFYTTTVERQARTWAVEVARERGRELAAVVRFDVDREALAALETLTFVRGDFDADDYWSFVVHCRSGGTDHARIRRSHGLYDVVIGPVAAFWRQRLTIEGADQMSFHTEASEAALNTSSRSISWTSSR
jgi:hypothetical protein